MATDSYALPSLSTDGWVVNTEKKADYLLGHFLVAEHSQDDFFPNVASFPYVMAQFGDSKLDLADQCERTLKNYFSAYFPSVSCECSIEDINDNPNVLRLHIGLSLVDVNGRSYDLNNVAKVENGKVVEIAKQNNGSLPFSVG